MPRCGSCRGIEPEIEAERRSSRFETHALRCRLDKLPLRDPGSSVHRAIKQSEASPEHPPECRACPNGTESDDDAENYVEHAYGQVTSDRTGKTSNTNRRKLQQLLSPSELLTFTLTRL